MEPGPTAPEWKGARVYLEADSIEIEGELVDQVRGKIAEAAGPAAAKMIKAAIRFKITEIRNIMAPP